MAKIDLQDYSDGLVLGMTDNKNIVIQHEESKISNRNVFVVGGPGSFKTQSYIFTNVVNNRNASIVVTDPKGEIYEQTVEIKKKQGYTPIVVNFKDMLLSSRWNPLLYIRKPSQTQPIANSVVAAKNDPNKKDFWYNSQMSLLNSLMLFLFYEYDPQNRNIESILDFLEQYDPRVNEDGVSELDEQFLSLPHEHEARRSYLLGFMKSEESARANIIISLLTTLMNFLDRAVTDFTSENDFYFEELGTKKVILYVLISPLDRTWDGLISLFFAQMFEELFYLGDKNNAKLPVPLVILFDEFVNLGFFATYENFLATCRGYRISVSTVIQSIPQLNFLYTPQKAQAIIGNHAIRICLGGVETETAKYFSELVGDTTVKVYTEGESQQTGKGEKGSKSKNYTFQQRRLITPDEVVNLEKETSLVVISGKPYKFKKAIQFKLFGNMLKEHEVSQLDYKRSQTPFAAEQMEIAQKEFIERRNLLVKKAIDTPPTSTVVIKDEEIKKDFHVQEDEDEPIIEIIQEQEKEIEQQVEIDTNMSNEDTKTQDTTDNLNQLKHEQALIQQAEQEKQEYQERQEKEEIEQQQILEEEQQQELKQQAKELDSLYDDDDDFPM